MPSRYLLRHRCPHAARSRNSRHLHIQKRHRSTSQKDSRVRIIQACLFFVFGKIERNVKDLTFTFTCLTRSSSNSSSNLERGRSSTNSSGVQQQNKDSLDKPGIGGASIESSKGRGFTNILTFKSNNDNEAGRSRIPSSRNYPSSPILPINSATNEEHNNPLTKMC